MPSVLVAMSGGVDSSVTAHLLREQGYDCVGATMLLRGDEDARRDAQDARDVCVRLGIPHLALDMGGAFDELVVGRFVEAYESGLTPNPCVVCNKLVKFGLLMEHARKMGCDFLATGHYARIVRTEGRHALIKALDPTKDQSYFLHVLTQGQLACTLLPLGTLTKTQVRAIAREQGFSNAQKGESQDICFIREGDYRAFLERRRGRPYPGGDVLTLDGTVVGRHDGAVGYTIGQRKGLGVALREPMYVCAKDMAANTVTLGPAEALMARSCTVEGWNWVLEEPCVPVRAAAKTHYRQREQPVTVVPLGEERVRLVFDEPQRAMTPGQAAVAYVGDAVLGGGTIAAVGVEGDA